MVQMADLTTKCLQCGKVFTIKDVPAGMSEAKCPHCGIGFVMEYDPELRPVGATRCPRCGEEVPLYTDKRPYRTYCPRCFERFMVK